MNHPITPLVLPAASAVLFALIALFPALSGADQSTFTTGEELATLVHERPDGEDASTRGTMTLREEGGRPREREMLTFTRDEDDGGTQTMIRFLSPGSIEDTGMLVHDHPDGSRDQWIYLPALDRVRRIASERQGGRFVGSDLFFEDLGDRLPKLDEHELKGEDTFEGQPVEILESKPVDADNSVYSKRLSWVHLETMIPLRIDFYQGGADAPMKRWTVQRIDRIDGYWTVMGHTVEDLDSGHTTTLVVDEIIYDQNLPQELFSSSGLADPGMHRDLRP